MAKSFAAQFRIEPDSKVDLDSLDPADLKAFPDRDAAENQSTKDAEAIDELQDRLYAEGKRALLVVLQGIDTSGKDGTIKHVFHETGPLGVNVTAFKKPSEEELAHDFLWRVHAAAPRRGFIGIFNRSHYEDVLVGRVRKLAPKDAIEARYGQINAFEKIAERERHHAFSSSCCTSPRRSRPSGCRSGSTSRATAGNSIRATSTTASCGMNSRRLTASCWNGVRPRGRLGMSSRPTRNGRATPPSPRSCAKRLEDMDPQYPKPDWDPKKFIIK